MALSGDAGGMPRTPVEAILAEVWAEVLGAGRIGLDDDFFELGGESLLVIRAVDRAGQRGLRVTPRLMFQHRTIALLAPHVTRIRDADWQPVTGSAPLTPIQRWLVAQDRPDPAHYNHAMLLEVPRPLRRAALAKAIRQLAAHHDALRMRFDLADDGQQTTLPVSHLDVLPDPLTWISLTGLDATAQLLAVEEHCARIQADMDPERGDLLRIGYFECGPARGDRLLIAVHHLAADGISGRVLAEDLWSAYEQAESGAEPRLPAKTASFVEWAGLLTKRARTAETRAEAGYWLELPWAQVTSLPVDHPGSPETEDGERALTVTLDEGATGTLLRRLTGANRPHINDVLLAAVARAVARWTGSDTVLLSVEAHGREPVVGEVDVSRTVGWFTSMYPVLLHAEPHYSFWETVDTTRTLLRAVPHHGIGYGLLRYLSDDEELRRRFAALPRPEIIFNYLGQFDQALGPFRFVPEPVGPQRGLTSRRSHRLIISGYVSGGRLHVEWAYDERSYHRGTIQALADDFIAGLGGFITDGG
jgi:non-ribosomal peptide synthase protein (TIGR01720 family)